MRHPIDLTGKIIGCWEVLELDELQYNQSSWKCRCTKCGAVEIIPLDASLSFKKLRRRQIRIYCDYIQMEGAVQV